jgi:DNA-binding LacI/PurR family transcriptional regulator
LNGGRQRPTLDEVALRAGVSRATVSRVVNGSTAVTPQVRAVVLRAVRETGYIPNLAARSLATHRTNSIALVLAEAANRVFSDDQFFRGIIRGVSQAAEEAGKQVLLMLAGSPDSHDRVERYAQAGHVDGVLVASAHGADPLPMALARTGIPVVCGGRPLDRSPVPYVDVDSVGGAGAAVRHLLERGRQRVATIAGPQDMVAGLDRLAGYRRALRRYPRRRSAIAFGDFTRESGAAAMRTLIERDPALDAVFAANDLMAHGALGILRTAGRRVPDDVAVVGFDDIESARYAEPPLTTVRQPIVEMGRLLARQLLRLAAGGPVEPAVVLPTVLIVRKST